MRIRGSLLLAVLAGCTPTRPAPATQPPSAAAESPVKSLFVAGTTFRFRLDDEVDTHDPEATGPARTKHEVTVRVLRARQIGSAVVAEVDWGLPGDFDWVTPPRLFALRDSAVWTLDGAFGPAHATEFDATDAELTAALSSTQPVLRAEEARSLQEKRHCAERRDEGSYGPTLEQLCFDAHGLAEWREENAHGPRVLELARLP